jgi:hypothetical protein
MTSDMKRYTFLDGDSVLSKKFTQNQLQKTQPTTVGNGYPQLTWHNHNQVASVPTHQALNASFGSHNTQAYNSPYAARNQGNQHSGLGIQPTAPQAAQFGSQNAYGQFPSYGGPAISSLPPFGRPAISSLSPFGRPAPISFSSPYGGAAPISFSSPYGGPAPISSSYTTSGNMMLGTGSSYAPASMWCPDNNSANTKLGDGQPAQDDFSYQMSTRPDLMEPAPPAEGLSLSTVATTNLQPMDQESSISGWPHGILRRHLGAELDHLGPCTKVEQSFADQGVSCDLIHP